MAGTRRNLVLVKTAKAIGHRTESGITQPAVVQGRGTTKNPALRNGPLMAGHCILRIEMASGYERHRGSSWVSVFKAPGVSSSWPVGALVVCA